MMGTPFAVASNNSGVGKNGKNADFRNKLLYLGNDRRQTMKD